MDGEVSVPLKPVEIEFSEKKSRFIGRGEKAETAEEAREKIQKRWDLFPDATHVVYAFLIGPPKSSSMGMSDDGEPKGTAGKPVLEVVKGSGVTNLLVTVVRYFGGTKLGTGGLVRAYSKAAKEVLRQLKTAPYEELEPFSCTIPYPFFDSAKRTILERGGRILDEQFGTAVQVIGEINKNMIQLLQSELFDLSNGTIPVSPVIEKE